jgi:hypothetical protein
MKAILVAAILATSFGGVAIADPAGDALAAKAEECIKSAAPKVAANSQSLTDAVNFLTNDLCGAEVQHATTYAQSLRSFEQLKATEAPSQIVGIKIDPETGELNTPPGFSMPLNMNTVMLNAFRATSGPALQLRSFAAKLVLAAKGK